MINNDENWYICHIVMGYQSCENNKVYVQESVHAMHALSIEDAKIKSREIIKEDYSGAKLKIINPETEETSEAEWIGSYLRQVIEVSFLADELGNGKIIDKSELTYIPMIFESKDDFFSYAQAAKGNKTIKAQLYENPFHYHFCA